MSYVPTVLIVDDSRLSRMLIRAFITQAHPDWTINEDSPQQAAGYQNPKPRTLKTAPFGRPDDEASYTFFRCLAA